MASKYKMNNAMRSYRALVENIDSLTQEEVLACLQLEAASQRRESVLNRLVKQATWLYSCQLKEKYLG